MAGWMDGSKEGGMDGRTIGRMSVTERWVDGCTTNERMDGWINYIQLASYIGR